MASTSKKKGLIVGGVAALALLLMLGMGGKKPAQGDQKTEPEPEPQPEPEPPPQEDVEDWTSNWGGYPDKLKPILIEAEKTSGIPGLARALAVWSWGSYRAGQPLVSTAEAKAIAAKNPDLCTKCHNETPGEVAQSTKALKNIPENWPKANELEAWKAFGSGGLFDILAGSNLYRGVDEGYTPFVNAPPGILLDPRVSAAAATDMVRRIISGPYKVMVPGIDATPQNADPRASWINIRRVTASPQGFIADTAENQAAGQRYAARADEIGIDLSKVKFPWPKGGIKAAWPGFKVVYPKLANMKF